MKRKRRDNVSSVTPLINHYTQVKFFENYLQKARVIASNATGKSMPYFITKFINVRLVLIRKTQIYLKN